MPKEKVLVIPVVDIDSFFVMTESSFNTRFLEFCTKNIIPIHFFNRYGYYTGTFYPRDYLISGKLIVNQVKHYTNKEKRLKIAKLFIDAAIFNIVKNLRYYNNRNIDLQAEIDTIQSLALSVNEQQLLN